MKTRLFEFWGLISRRVCEFSEDAAVKLSLKSSVLRAVAVFVMWVSSFGSGGTFVINA